MPLGICLHSFTIINFLRYMNPVMTDRPAVVFSLGLTTAFPVSLYVLD